MKIKLLILPILLAGILLITGCSKTQEAPNNKNNTGDNTNKITIANPASVYCEDNGGTLELIFDNNESYGICHFNNGESCEERDFYNHDCFPTSGKTEKKIKKTTKDITGDITQNTTICAMDAKKCLDGSYVGRTGPNCKFEECPKTKENKETITDMIKNYANTTGDQTQGLTENDIDLMEAIIQKLK